MSNVSEGFFPPVASGGGSGTVTSVAVSGSDGVEIDSGSPVTTAGTIAIGVNAASMRSHINVEDNAAADQSDAEIETAYNNQVSVVSQVEAEAGTATTVRRWTAQRVAQAIAALESGGGGFEAYPGVFSLSGSQNITTTEATLAFDTEDLDPDGNYANSSGEITVTNGGYFQVSVCVPVNDDGSGGATRGRVFMFGQRDQGSATWVNDAQTRLRAQDYHREAGGGSGVNMSGIVQLADGEAFRVRIDVSSSTDVSAESGEASLSIHRIRAT